MNICIIQARMGSTRLPGKILKDLQGKPMLWHVVERCRASKKLDNVVIATTSNPEDDAVEKFCKEYSIPYFRGSVEDVLERYYEAAKMFGADIIVRVTSDCPLIDGAIIDACIEAFEKGTYDYVSNINPGPRTFPRGLDTEVFSFPTLERAYKNAHETYEREHVTPYIWENKNGAYRIGPTVVAGPGYAADYRLTVDYPEDFRVAEEIYKKFFVSDRNINVKDVLRFLDLHPEIVKINEGCAQTSFK